MGGVLRTATSWVIPRRWVAAQSAPATFWTGAEIVDRNYEQETLARVTRRSIAPGQGKMPTPPEPLVVKSARKSGNWLRL